jgi:hypothetical protein
MHQSPWSVGMLSPTSTSFSLNCPTFHPNLFPFLNHFHSPLNPSGLSSITFIASNCFISLDLKIYVFASCLRPTCLHHCPHGRWVPLPKVQSRDQGTSVSLFAVCPRESKSLRTTISLVPRHESSHVSCDLPRRVHCLLCPLSLITTIAREADNKFSEIGRGQCTRHC